MFTGIVTDVGEVLDLKQEGDLRARIGTAMTGDGIDIGASIACDGVCLTVIDRGRGAGGRLVRRADFSAETVSKTNWPLAGPPASG
jgi:riboflavin synthase